MSIESDAMRTPVVADRAGQGDTPRRFFTNSRVAISALLLLAIAVNCPYQYVVAKGTLGRVDSVSDFELSSRQLPVMAGWPFRYLISYSDSGGEDSRVRRFSGWALLGNLALASFVIASVGLYFRRGEGRGVAGNAARGRISIADALVLAAILAVLFALWHSVDAGRRKDLALSKRIAQSQGGQIDAAWVPGVFAPWLPDSLTEHLRRIRAVRIEKPPSELMERIIKQCDLTSLRTSGGDYDLRLLDRLADNPHLHDLRISQRTIDEQSLQWIASNPRIDSLNLMWTSLPGNAFNYLPANLERLNLLHSDAVLGDLGSPPMSKSIRELFLPRPGPGVAGNVTIDEWPQLKALVIYDPWEVANPTPMAVRLANLPSLERIGLCEYQQFDLTLRNLPRLTMINQEQRNLNHRPLGQGAAVPDSVWFSRFDAQGLPELERLRFYGMTASYFRILDSPRFEMLGVSNELRTADEPIRVSELPTETVAAIIDGISASDGPVIADLSMVPLAEANLAPLADNHRLERILLSGSKTNRKHWTALAPMHWLKGLEVTDCPIDEDVVQWALATFPNLEHFGFSLITESESFQSDPSALTVMNHPNIRTIDFGVGGSGLFGTQFLQRVRVIDSPNFAIPLILDSVEQVEVVNAQSLVGISINGPLPEQFKLSGLRDLRFLAVGGPTVNDELIRVLEPCVELRTITLAYPGVTETGLTGLGRFTKLTSLNLPGSALNDAIILGWPLMNELTNLDIRDTGVTGLGLKRLVSGRKITRLVLKNSQVSSKDLAVLGELSELSELMLAGIGIEPDSLAAVLANKSLTRLDLSDAELSPAILDHLIADAEMLEFLVLQNCDVDHQKLSALAEKYPLLRFDLDGSTVSSSLLSRLLVSERIVDAGEWDQIQEIQRTNTAARAGNRVLDTLSPSIIDVDSFAEMSRVSSPP